MPRSNTGTTVGAAAGTILGGGIGGTIGGAIGGAVSGLFDHRASNATLQRTYDSMPAWVQAIVSGAEFSALEQHRQAGFFANDVVRTVDGFTSQEQISSYRQWSSGNYRPEVNTLTQRILDEKSRMLSGASSNLVQPPQAGAETMGIIPTSQQISGAFKGDKWLIIGFILLVIVGIVFMLRKSK